MSARARKRTAGWLAVLAAAVVLFYAKEARVSGSHAIRFLEPSFIYEYDEGVRKAFFSSEDADSYFTSKRERSTRVFTAALPVFARFFQDAQKHGIRLLELRLRTLSPSALQSPPIESAEQLLARAGEVYPRLVKLNLNAGNRSAYDSNHLLVLLGKGLDREQASWLGSRIAELRFSALAARESEITSVREDAGKRFLPGVAAVRVGKNFALSVGMTDEIRPENQALWSAQAEALATELLPTLTSAFADKETLRPLFTGDPGQLLSLDEKLGKRPEGAALAKLFNPYGPLLDSLGMRSAVQVGGLRVTLLFVVQGAWGARPTDPQPTYGLTQWLQRIGEGRAQTDATIDSLLKRVEDPRDADAQKAALEQLVQLAKEPALRTVGGQRVIDYFVQHAQSDRAKDSAKDSARKDPAKDPVRGLAIANLRWIDCPERRRVYLELVKSRRNASEMPTITQALADLPDDETAAALIAAMGDKEASDDSRSWARNGLQTMANHLSSRADPRTAALQERIKRALDGSSNR